ncbi:hypothetical protein MMC22_011786 [Lobaria immixta]|nr:hypothetical protein [Lobaria immixta]
MDDLITQGNHILMMKYGDTFKLFRQILHKHFAETVCEKEYSKLQHAEAAQMMKDFCMEPGRHMEHPKRFSNSIIMSIVYGVRSPDYNTPHLKDLYAMTEQLQKILQPGAAPPVDIFPILKFVPNRWWGDWITMAQQYGKDKDALYKGMLNQVLERHAREGSRNSMMDAVIEQQDKLQLTPSQLESLGGALIEGGSETTSNVLLTFIHTIISHPEAQMEAQAEIDRVIGEDRSPLWSDYEQLLYVSMIIKETMRWRPIAPTGFPHYLTEDDWVDGKFLPKGTTVLVNVWGLHHDPVTIPDPDTFSPEHYSTRTQPASKYAVSPDYEERDHYNYGGGRRLCPGIHLAERNLFIAVAKLLWGFDFRPIRDAQGNYVEVDVDVQAAYHEGFLRCPKDFQCEVKPRSEKRRAVIMAEFEAAAQDVLSKYD